MAFELFARALNSSWNNFEVFQKIWRKTIFFLIFKLSRPDLFEITITYQGREYYLTWCIMI